MSVGIDDLALRHAYLAEVRRVMIARQWTLEYINAQIRRVRTIYKWAVSLELVPPDRYYALQSLPAIKDKTITRQAKRTAVDDADIEVVIHHLSPTVAAMVRFQRLTGCRPQEVCRLRIEWIEQTKPGLWHYRPIEHKTEHHGILRTIPLGPKAIEIVTRYIDGRTSGRCFGQRSQWPRSPNCVDPVQKCDCENASTVLESRSAKNTRPRLIVKRSGDSARHACDLVR